MIDLLYYDKGLKKADLKEINRLKGKPVWIDITDIKKEEAETVAKAFNLHPLTTEDLLNANTRIKVEEFPNYLFSIFYGIEKKKGIELVELDFILGANFIISNHKKEISSYDELKKNKEKLEMLFEKGVDFIFHRLLDIEVDNFFPILETIDDEIESIEEEVTRKARPELLTKILKVKRNIVLIKKSVLPQREKISFLTRNDYSFISEKSIPYFRDIYDHAIRVSDAIDNYREAVGGTFDAYMSSISNNMNEVMKMLSFIATVALPLTVISGIYGTNFAVLPGQNLPFGFWSMIIVMVLLTGGMVYLFKRKGWF